MLAAGIQVKIDLSVGSLPACPARGWREGRHDIGEVGCLRRIGAPCRDGAKLNAGHPFAGEILSRHHRRRRSHRRGCRVTMQPFWRGQRQIVEQEDVSDDHAHSRDGASFRRARP
jgi:hypothetical protein